jgi:Glyoxalase-like domain
MPSQIDHLVIAAISLDQAADWCETALGASAAPGGQHARMGTHNLLLRLNDGVYLEMIAIDPALPAPANQPRWYGLDDPDQQRALQSGPRLVHWVARHDAALQTLFDDEQIQDFSRADYAWQMGLRAGTAPLMGGTLPLRIHWTSAAHPCERLPASNCRLMQLELHAHDAARLRQHLRAMQFAPDPAIKVLITPAAQNEKPTVRALLDTPAGLITL